MATIKDLASAWLYGGTPAAAHKPSKSDGMAVFQTIDTFVNAYMAGGGIVFTTRALLYADLAHAANVMAWVVADPTVAYNGIYEKSGASDSGSWVRVADLPYQIIRAVDAGAGTPNAIIATSSIPTSDGAIVLMNIADTTTSTTVTVAFNDLSPLSVKTNSGLDPISGTITAGMYVMGFVAGSTFRLITDAASSSIIAAAEAVVAPYASHIGAGGSAHALATTSVAGFMSAADKVRIGGSIRSAASYASLAAAFASGVVSVYATGAYTETVSATEGSRLELDETASLTGTIAGIPVRKGNRFSWAGDYEASLGQLNHTSARHGNVGTSDRNSLAVVRGTQTAPDSSTMYANTAAYIELHSSSAPTSDQSVWGNAYKIPALTVEAIAHSGFEGELVGGSFRSYGVDQPNPALATGKQALVGMSSIAQSNTGSGNASWSVWGANIIAAQTSGNAPPDIVGIEVDVLNKSSSAGLRPGEVGASNYTGVWVQSDAAAGAQSDAGFYASHTAGSGGWRNILLSDGNINDWAIYLRTRVNAPTAQGIRMETAYGSSGCNVIELVAATNNQLVVSGASDNPVNLRAGSTYGNVQKKSFSALASGDQVLILV